MKTKNMRKKALIASLAMLLVAVVALSGATYAWFASNTAAKASGLSFKSSQPSSLLFADKGSPVTDESKWVGAYDITYTANTLLTPCSSLNGASFIEVKDVTAAGTESTTLVKSIAEGGKTATYEFDVKSTAPDTPLYVKSITASNNASIAPAIRIAVKVGDNAAKVFCLGTAQTTYAVTAVSSYVQDSASFAKFYSNEDIEGITKTQRVITTANTADALVATLGANVPQTISITVWLEGNDSRCNNTAMGQIIDSFEFNFGTSI